MFEACTPNDSRWNLSPLPELFEVFSLRSSALIYKPATFEVRLKESNLKGFWEVGGTLQVVGGSLLVTTYGSLTLAAQFKDDFG